MNRWEWGEAGSELGASGRARHLRRAFFETFGDRVANLPEQLHEDHAVGGFEHFENGEHRRQSSRTISVVRRTPRVGHEHIDAPPVSRIDAALDEASAAVLFEGANDARHLGGNDANLLLNLTDRKRFGLGEGIEAEELRFGEFVAAARLARTHDRHELPKLENVIRHLLEATLLVLAQPVIRVGAMFACRSTTDRLKPGVREVRRDRPFQPSIVLSGK